MEKHTKEFECQHCPLKTHYLYSLKAHIRRNHSDMLDKKN